ncbi:hypothetical protein HUJ04_013485 [Dendroctonus ponderosae]|nr:hypothetical protein HUJ04_013485 [Dendroctonus ponderosae]KAH1006150.1 hypothetical protein HUJ05_006915 [Dendroctonus ponderosae]
MVSSNRDRERSAAARALEPVALHSFVFQDVKVKTEKGRNGEGDGEKCLMRNSACINRMFGHSLRLWGGFQQAELNHELLSLGWFTWGCSDGPTLKRLQAPSDSVKAHSWKSKNSALIQF